MAKKVRRTKKVKRVSKSPVVADKRLPMSVCEGMTVKQIRASKEYRGLTPLGRQNKSGSYRYGHKSTMRKGDLCRVLDNPSLYHREMAELKAQKKMAGPRKRATRKGECLVEARKIPCNGPVFKFQAVTTTGKPCCFKKRMKQKTINKRLGNVTAAIRKQNKSARKKVIKKRLRKGKPVKKNVSKQVQKLKKQLKACESRK